MDLENLVELSAPAAGGAVLSASDEQLGAKDGLLNPAPPRLGARDGWETRRRRGGDSREEWCVIRLGVPGVIRGILLDGRNYEGDLPETVSVEACVEDRPVAPVGPWTELLPPEAISGQDAVLFEIQDGRRYTHVRVKLRPDGGLSRVRVYGEAAPNWALQPSVVNLASLALGTRVAAASPAIDGNPRNLLTPGADEGWLTARRREPGADYLVLQFGVRAAIERIEIDTTGYTGNAPEAIAVRVGSGAEMPEHWETVLPETPLQPNCRHVFKEEVESPGAADWVRIDVIPDGGIRGLVLQGVLGEQHHSNVGLKRLNAMDADLALEQFLRCCHSMLWAESMVARRPLRSVEQALTAAEDSFWNAGRQGWIEAMQREVRIGQRAGDAWSQQERAILDQADPQVLTDLWKLARKYEVRFGYPYVTPQLELPANEIMKTLLERLENDPGVEIQVAAKAQLELTLARLRRLLGAS
jgi:allantoicase